MDRKAVLAVIYLLLNKPAVLHVYWYLTTYLPVQIFLLNHPFQHMKCNLQANMSRTPLPRAISQAVQAVKSKPMFNPNPISGVAHH